MVFSCFSWFRAVLGASGNLREPLGCSGAARRCPGLAWGCPGLPWSALVLPWCCSGAAVKLRWGCPGYALGCTGLPWGCPDAALGPSWAALGLPQGCLYKCFGRCTNFCAPCKSCASYVPCTLCAFLTSCAALCAAPCTAWPVLG